MVLLLDSERELARLEKLAEWLDAKYRAPFGVRVGWDGILGLVPIVGPLVTTLISGYLVVCAALFGASPAVLLRMGLNVVIDDVIGLVPFIGWLGDFAWKANLKNTRLLREFARDPGTTRRKSAWIVGLTAAAVLAVAVGFAILVFYLAVIVVSVLGSVLRPFFAGV